MEACALDTPPELAWPAADRIGSKRVTVAAEAAAVKVDTHKLFLSAPGKTVVIPDGQGQQGSAMALKVSRQVPVSHW